MHKCALKTDAINVFPTVIFSKISHQAWIVYMLMAIATFTVLYSLIFLLTETSKPSTCKHFSKPPKQTNIPNSKVKMNQLTSISSNIFFKKYLEIKYKIGYY